MEKKLYVGTKLFNNQIHLTFSNNKDDLINVLLVSDADNVDDDLEKIATEKQVPVYVPF